jgi:hypothetical protein
MARNSQSAATAADGLLISIHGVSDTSHFLRQQDHGMKNANCFSVPFESLRTVSGGRVGSYVIGAMFSAEYRAQAERLAASCEKFGCQYELHEVPAVHNSISDHGTENLAYTKPNFIRHLLVRHWKPVLYVDADCEFLSQPDLIDELVKSRRDFAIYNHCADKFNARFKPIELGGDATRFYQLYGSIDWYSNDQLVCSGLVQFYGYSIAARALLNAWHRTIATHKGCADDEALDFTFNNLAKYSLQRLLLRVYWLPKRYARVAYWIYVNPVINHAEFPSDGTFNPINHPVRKRFYSRKAQRRYGAGTLPRNCIIDTQQGLICKLVDGLPVSIGETKGSFWL